MMKRLFITCWCLLSPLFSLFSQNGSEGRTLSVVFVSPTAPPESRSFLELYNDKFTDSDGFLYYLSRGSRPYFTNKKSRSNEFINRMTELDGSTQPGRIEEDLQIIATELINFKDLGYTKIDLYLIIEKDYLWSNTVNSEMSREEFVSRWINFFPAYSRAILNQNLVVNIQVVSPDITVENANYLTSKASFGQGSVFYNKVTIKASLE